MKHNEKNVENVNELPDSISWGSASKGAKKKVYGDILNAPFDFGKKIENIKLAEKLALGEISRSEYEDKVGGL